MEPCDLIVVKDVCVCFNLHRLRFQCI